MPFFNFHTGFTLSLLLVLAGCGGGGGGDSTTPTPADPPSRNSISSIVFSDPSLAACVQSEAARNSLLFSDEVKSLDCSESNVALLDGLELLTNLETLDLSGTRIRTVAKLSVHTRLRVLDLSSISELREIGSLLALNQLSTIDFSDSGRGNLECSTLDSLSQTASSLTRPSTCVKRIADVSFTDASLQSCVSALVTETGAIFTRDVSTLDCTSAGIAQLDGIESFENLVSINLNGNAITELAPLSLLTKLEFLFLAENPISNVISLSQLPALLTLDLSRIPGLTNIDNLLSSTTLKELILDETGNGALGCSVLDSLSSQTTSISGFIACDMLISDVVFENANLEQCVLAKAATAGITLTSELTNINDCTNQSITSLVGMEKFTNLESVDFSSTGISSLEPLRNLLKLRGLLVNNNSIRNFHALDRLTELRLIEARNNVLLADVSTVLYMENVKFLRLSGSGTATGLSNGISCQILDQLEADISTRDFGDPTSPPEFERPETCDNTPAPGFNAFAQTDMDDDGKSDILLEKVGLSSWRIGVSDATTFNKGSLFDEDANARAIAVADANNDGKDDLLIQVDNIDGTRGWQVLSSDGTALTKFGPFITIDGVGVADDTRAVAFKDIDGDGNADILIQTQVTVGNFSFVKYYTSFGTGTGYTLPDSVDDLYSFAQSSGRTEIIALEDVNGDGTADFVFSRMLDDKYCFFVRAFKNGAFEEQSGSTDCASTKVLKGNKIEIVGVADINGNGQSELVIRKSNAGRNNWFFYSLTQGASGTEWSKAATGLLTTDIAPGSTERTITLSDLNKDGRVDILNEVTQGTLRTWVAYIAKDYGLFETQTWMTRDESNIQAKDRKKTLGVLDFNGDGFPDLLTETSDGNTQAQLLFVQLNNGTSFNSSTTWHNNVLQRENVIGLEKNGLTNIAKDTTALIAWAGVADKLYTLNEFSAFIASKGSNGSSLVLVQGAALSQPLKEGECKINYGGDPSANVTENKFSVGAEAGFGLLVCNQKIGDRLTLKTQVIFGGCSTTIGLTGSGAKCEIGVYQGEMELELTEGFTQTLKVQLPNAEACGGVNTSYICAKVGAELASVSAKTELAGVGGGAKLAIGVGLGADFKVDDGVISGSIDLKFLVGGSIEFSLDFPATGKFFYNVGESSYIFVQSGALEIIKAAGPAIMNAAYFTGDAIEIVAGGSVFIVEGAAGIAIIIFEDIGGAIEDIFNGIASGISSAVGAIIDIGESVVDGIGEAFGAIGDIF